MQDQQILKPNQVIHEHSNKQTSTLPQIPDKIYFTIGEVGKLCLLEPYVLRYWEQEFPQLHPIKRRGNRRYYKRDEIILIRRIKNLLYEQGYTIEGARIKLESDKNNNTKPDDIQSTEIINKVVRQLNTVLADLEDE